MHQGRPDWRSGDSLGSSPFPRSPMNEGFHRGSSGTFMAASAGLWFWEFLSCAEDTPMCTVLTADNEAPIQRLIAAIWRGRLPRADRYRREETRLPQLILGGLTHSTEQKSVHALLDLQMPGLSGVDTLHRLHVPVPVSRSSSSSAVSYGSFVSQTMELIISWPSPSPPRTDSGYPSGGLLNGSSRPREALPTTASVIVRPGVTTPVA